MLFHYKATTKKGELQEGELLADSDQDVIRYLHNAGLIPLSVKAKKGLLATSIIPFFKRRISIDEKIFLSRYLGLMLSSGLDILKSIDILREDLAEGSLRNFLLEIRSVVEQGRAFYTGFENHPEMFSEVEVSLIKAGETSGNLEKTLQAFAADLEKEKEFKAKIRAALIYPSLLVAVSIGVIILITTFVMPRIAKLFSEAGTSIPVYSRIVLNASLFIGDHILLLAVVFVGFVIGTLFAVTKTDVGQYMYRYILKKIGVINRLILNRALRNFSLNLAMLVGAGMPIIRAMEIVALSVGNFEVREAILRIAKDYVPRGLTLGEGFHREAVFPKILTGLIAVGEQAGHLPDILKTMGNFYEVELDTSLKNLVVLIEPLILLVIGFIVALIAISVIVPIYQAVTQF